MSALRQLTFDLPHHTAMGQEDFLEAECNQSALNTLLKWPNWPTPAVILSGEAGSGKTHLASVWAAKSHAQFIDCHDLRNTPDLFEKTNPVFVVEDIHRYVGREEDEQILFHLYNHVKNANGSLLMTTEKDVSFLKWQLPDLKSRLHQATTLTIQEPDDMLLKAVMMKLFFDRQILIDERTLNYAITRIERSFDAVRTLVEDIDKLSLEEKKRVTVNLISTLVR